MKMRNSAYVRSIGGVFGGRRGAAWRLAVAVGLVFAITTPVQADAGLSGAVAASYFPRNVDAGLHSIAHARASEISACPTCMNHALMRAGTAEVLAYNFGSADPIGEAVAGWRNSPVHNSILGNGSLGSIGCAQVSVAGVSYFACVLAAGPLPAAPAPAPAPAPPPPSSGSSGGGSVAGGQPVTQALPDTSAPLGDSENGTRVAFV